VRPWRLIELVDSDRVGSFWPVAHLEAVARVPTAPIEAPATRMRVVVVVVAVVVVVSGAWWSVVRGGGCLVGGGGQWCTVVLVVVGDWWVGDDYCQWW
jgi:hypothetical protein